MNVYRVWYSDPSSGMNSRSQEQGFFISREAAEAFIAPRATGWAKEAYRIEEIAVRAVGEETPNA